MLTLKNYQERALDSLRTFFKHHVRLGRADLAFVETTKETFKQGINYKDVDALPGLPYVCLRIPTGGGKTLVACHAVQIAARDFQHIARATVLWLVPSNAIREQTLAALKNRRHPYRQALENAGGPLEILDVSEALHVQPGTFQSATVIIVATMQAFRVEETDGRKVYEDDGSLMANFQDVPENERAGLECFDNGTPKRSLANLLRLRRPIVIVDEAHNARTPLSFDTLARFKPACIVEFTATPDTGSQNVLHSTSAAELAAEGMIKLPIRLETRPAWKEVLADAIAMRGHLEALARKERDATGEYIRPVMLLQAQAKRKDQDTLTVEKLEAALRDDFRIPEIEIAIATGVDKGLEGVDIASPDCPIRFVITIQALREGWDCPFAYVLCSVSDSHSATAVEQILGRIMRLPKATPKQHPELNKAYAFASAQNWPQVAAALADGLVQNGFQKQEAQDLIVPGRETTGQIPFGNPDTDPDSFMGIFIEPNVQEAPKLHGLPEALHAKVSFDPEEKTLTFRGMMQHTERETLEACFSTPEGKAAVERVFLKSNGAPAAAVQRIERLTLPLLAVKTGTLFDLFEDQFRETPWKLSECEALLSEAEFPKDRPQGQVGEVTVTDKGRLQTRFLNELHADSEWLNTSTDEHWTEATLVNWLDRNISHHDVELGDSAPFMGKAVRRLQEDRGFALAQLVRDRFRLRDALETKVQGHRDAACKTAFQKFLLPDCATPLAVTPELAFSFDPLQYPYSYAYKGAFKFQKHYYPRVGDLEDGEECECAQFIDSMPEVKCWVRNLAKRPEHSFWLQTSTDRFYPDFVCLLNDGRYLIVEYKGGHLWDGEDAKEKRVMGGVYEARAGGKYLFIMPKDKDLQAIKAKAKPGPGQAKLF